MSTMSGFVLSITCLQSACRGADCCGDGRRGNGRSGWCGGGGHGRVCNSPVYTRGSVKRRCHPYQGDRNKKDEK